jgi:hypothetical protein
MKVPFEGILVRTAVGQTPITSMQSAVTHKSPISTKGPSHDPMLEVTTRTLWILVL